MPRSSLALPRVEPAYANFPAYVETFGPEVADLCDLAGFAPDPEQEQALDALFGIGRDGLAVAFEFAILAARQNIKTGLEKQAALGWLFITRQRRITWSAHEMTPTREAFEDLVNLIEGTPSLAKQLDGGATNGVFRGSGQEAIVLKPSKACPDGQKVKFKARTYSGGRGLTGDKVILDEAFALKKSHLGSLMPTLSARPDPQLIYGSSACQASSEVLHKVVQRGRSVDPAPRKRLAYMEFCAPEDACESYPECPHWPGTPGCAMDKREFIQMANTQAGRRISWEYIEAERAALDPEEFGRERLGWHDAPDATEEPLISAETWVRLTDTTSTPVDPVCFAVYVNKDRSRSAIAVAGWRADRKFHVGIVPAVRDKPIDSLPGTGWIPDRIKELATEWKPCAVIIDGRSAAASLIPDIEDLGIEVEKTNATFMKDACGSFYDSVTAVNADGEPAGTLRHTGTQPLHQAVTSGKKRDLEDAWAWDRKDRSSDITQLVAVTLALHGLIVHGRPPTVDVWEPFYT